MKINFAWQEQDAISRGSRQSGPFCPSCEHPLHDDNQLRRIPEYLVGIKDADVPPRLRGVAWQDDGCQACVDELVCDFAKHWLSRGVGSMEDVAGLIAEHLELDLRRKETA